MIGGRGGGTMAKETEVKFVAGWIGFEPRVEGLAWIFEVYTSSI